ncbi:MAG: VOC family protein [Ilumatobacteraceae bacterium]
MQVTGVTANLPVSDVEAARRFYGEYLGLSVEVMNLGWVARYRTEDGRASVQLVTRDLTSPVDSVLSAHVGDAVDAAHAEAQRLGYEIVHRLAPFSYASAGGSMPQPGRRVVRAAAVRVAVAATLP